MALKIRMDADHDWNLLWHEAQARKIVKKELAPPANPELVYYRVVCWGCGEGQGWAKHGQRWICEECLAEHTEETQPQEMVVKHIVEHVQSNGEFQKEILH